MTHTWRTLLSSKTRRPRSHTQPIARLCARSTSLIDNPTQSTAIPQKYMMSELMHVIEEDMASPTTSPFFQQCSKLHQSINSDSQNAQIFNDSAINSLKSCLNDLLEGYSHVLRAQKAFAVVMQQQGSLLVGNRENETDDSDDWATNARMAIGTQLLKLAVLESLRCSVTNFHVTHTKNRVIPAIEEAAALGSAVKEARKAEEKANKEYEQRLAKYAKSMKSMAKESGMTPRTITGADTVDALADERANLSTAMVQLSLATHQHLNRRSTKIASALISYYDNTKLQLEDFNAMMIEYVPTLDSMTTAITALSERNTADVTKLKALHARLTNDNLTSPEPLSPKKSLPIGMPTDVKSTAAHFTRPPTNNAAPTTTLLPTRDASSPTGASATLSGYLYKRSTTNKLLRVKRLVCLVGNTIELYHSDECLPPQLIDVLTCELRANYDDSRVFDIVSTGRVYNLQAESADEAVMWISTLRHAHNAAQSSEFAPCAESLSLIDRVMAVAGNKYCADCKVPLERDDVWIVTNIGITICVQCSGVHSHLGTHVSRVHSLTLDRLSNAQLLLLLAVGNDRANHVYEGKKKKKKVVEQGPTTFTPESRTAYITEKYVRRASIYMAEYTEKTVEEILESMLPTPVLHLIATTRATGSTVFPSGHTCLTKVIEDGSPRSLPITELFIVNGFDVNKSNYMGVHPLQVAVDKRHIDHVKLLLKSRRCHAQIITDLRQSLKLETDEKSVAIKTLLQLAESGQENDESAQFELINLPEFLTRQTTAATLRRLSRLSQSSSSSTLERSGTLESLAADKSLPPEPVVEEPVPTAAERKPSLKKTYTLDDYVPMAPKNSSEPSTSPKDDLNTVQEMAKLTAYENCIIGSRSTDAKPDVPIAKPRDQPPPLPLNPPPPTLPPRSTSRVHSTALTKTIKTCRAIFECTPDMADELAFKCGDVIHVTSCTVEGEDSNWMEGYVATRPSVLGIFPVNFVTFEK